MASDTGNNGPQLGELISSPHSTELIGLDDIRPFLGELPLEVWLHVFRFISDPRTLVRAIQVSKAWMELATDESLWHCLCDRYGFALGPPNLQKELPFFPDYGDEPLEEMEEFASLPLDPALQWLSSKKQTAPSHELHPGSSFPISYREFFKKSYSTLRNWHTGGTLLRAHPISAVSQEDSEVTCVALDSDWIVVGSANSKIHVFSARTGVLSRTLVGHRGGVWGLQLIGRHGYNLRRKSDEEGIDLTRPNFSFPAHIRRSLGLEPEPPEIVPLIDDGEFSSSRAQLLETPSEPCSVSQGWGQPNSLIVSGGCDKALKVWDVKTGICIYTLRGHSSLIRCLKTLHYRPLAITGSRDGTLRIWNIQWGAELRVLEGHQGSIRCLDACGHRVVSGSYDWTCRIWDIDTGKCIHVLSGHRHRILCIAFDGVRIASGGQDTTIRIWDPDQGTCVALLQTHTTLVCHLQLSPSYSSTLGQHHRYPSPDDPVASSSPSGACYDPLLLSGSYNGRVIAHSLETFQPRYCIAAHQTAVASLQFDEHFLITGGSDGRVRVFETGTGHFIRDWYDSPDPVHQTRKSSGKGKRRRGKAAEVSEMHAAPPITYYPAEGARLGDSEMVWKAAFGGSWATSKTDQEGYTYQGRLDVRGKDVCSIMCRRGGRTVVEMWRMAPGKS